MNANVIGSLVFAVPAIAAAWLLLWRRYRPVFWSVLAMIVIVTGYLNATGATRDLAGAVGVAPMPAVVPATVPAR